MSRRTFSNFALVWLVSLVVAVCALLQVRCAPAHGAENPYHKQATEFAAHYADLVMRERYEEAYALRASVLTKDKPLDAFIQEQREARVKFGVPLSQRVWVEYCYPDAVVDWYGKVPDVDPNSMRAWVCVSLGVKTGGRLTDCFDMYLLLIEEQGAWCVASDDYIHCE